MFPTICLVDDWAQDENTVLCHGLAAESKCRVVKRVFDKFTLESTCAVCSKNKRHKEEIRDMKWHEPHTWVGHSCSGCDAFWFETVERLLKFTRLKNGSSHKRTKKHWQVNWHLDKHCNDLQLKHWNVQVAKIFFRNGHDLRHTPESFATTCGNTECQISFPERWHNGWAQPLFRKASPFDSAIPWGATFWTFYVAGASTGLALSVDALAFWHC